MTDPAENLREDYLREMRRRFRRLRGDVRTWTGYEEDIFGLAEKADVATTKADLPDGAPEVFRFQTDSRKAAAFLDWFRQRLDEDVMEPMDSERVQQGEHWTAEHVRATVAQGWQQGRSRLRNRGVKVGSLPGDDGSDLIEALFDLPAPRRALQELYTRNYENLQSVGADTAEPVRETLLTGLDEGWNPRKMADELSSEVETIQRTRAEVLARTETMNAYSEATVERYRQAGVDTVRHGEWSDAGDDRVCPICKQLDGREIPLDTIDGATFEFEPSEDEPDYLAGVYAVKPPAHPQGRCVLLPDV